MDISVIIPLYNEAESLPELTQWIERVMQENRYTGFYKALLKEDIVLPMRALANSAAIMEIPTAHSSRI